jgi:DNA polymerase-1
VSKYLLVDGNSLTYRAFFALPSDMATASGQVTNAVFGFTSMLILVLKEQKPDGVLVAFDRPEPTFRHEADAEYKANREAAPDILRQQMGLVRQVLDALGIQQVDVAGWEADDLIASACEVLVARGDDVVIVTGDRDSYQLVSDPHVKVLYNRRGVSDYALYDEAGIEEKTGVRPAMYPQYAALRGDTSDNLPGVPGVGEKTAAKLINEYGGLDGIFANVEKQSPKLRANLTEHEQRARKNLDLMVLRRDAPLDAVDFDALAIAPKPDEVKRLFDFLEFRTFSDRLAEALGPSAGIAPAGPRDELVAEVEPIESPAAAAALVSGLDTLDLAGAWSGEPGRSALVGLAFVIDPSAAAAAWLPTPLLLDEQVAKAIAGHSNVRAHNAKAILRSLLELGIDLAGLRLDTAIAAYLIDPAEARYDLPDLIVKFTKYAPPSSAAAAGQLDLDGTSVGDADLAARDALAVHHIAEPIEASLAAQGMSDL